MVDLANFVLTTWSGPPSRSRQKPLVIYGPPDTSEIVELWIRGVHKKDLASRLEIPHPYVSRDIEIEVTDIAQAGTVYEQGDIRVSCVFLEHARPIIDSLAYRIDYRNKAIVIAGDTSPVDALTTLAAGADLLTHEAGFSREDLEELPEFRTWHTAPEDLGELAEAARVRQVVLKHLSMKNPQPIMQG